MMMLNFFRVPAFILVLACVHSYKYSTNSGWINTRKKTSAIMDKKIPRRRRSDSLTRNPTTVSERPQMPIHHRTVIKEYPSDLYLCDKGICGVSI
jgi:hypothetical protein